METSTYLSNSRSSSLKSPLPPGRRVRSVGNRVHDLPAEILSEIFLLVGQDAGWYRKNLMLVCWRWHDIVLSTPGIPTVMVQPLLQTGWRSSCFASMFESCQPIGRATPIGPTTFNVVTVRTASDFGPSVVSHGLLFSTTCIPGAPQPIDKPRSPFQPSILRSSPILSAISVDTAHGTFV